MSKTVGTFFSHCGIKLWEWAPKGGVTICWLLIQQPVQWSCVALRRSRRSSKRCHFAPTSSSFSSLCCCCAKHETSLLQKRQKHLGVHLLTPVLLHKEQTCWTCSSQGLRYNRPPQRISQSTEDTTRHAGPRTVYRGFHCDAHLIHDGWWWPKTRPFVYCQVFIKRKCRNELFHSNGKKIKYSDKVNFFLYGLI